MKKLLSLLLFCLAFIATANATTLTGTLNNPDGSGFTGTLYVSIAQQVGISSLGSCGGPILVVPTSIIAIGISNGTMVSENGTSTSSPFLYGGDCTLPASMPYNATLKDANGNTMFSSMWLVTGSTQNVGTIYQGPQPIPPTAFTAVYMIGSPAGIPCSAQSMAVQTNGSGGSYLFPCINGVFVAQGGGGGGGGGLAIGNAVTGGTANSPLFVDGSGNLGQDNSNYSYDSTSHVLTVVQPIVAGITGNANTATSFSVTPSTCAGSQVAYGISIIGNAQCKTLTYADIGGSSPGLVISVFGRSGVVLAVANDYNFNQIAGTVSSAQLAGSGAIALPAAGVMVSTGTAVINYGVTGSGTIVALSTSPIFVTPMLGVATATSINGTTIPSSATLVTTSTSVLAAQMPAFTGDATSTAGTVALSVVKINGVPFCAGFAPTNGQTFEYTTGGSPNPCYSSVSGTTGIMLKTNGTTNPVQSTLNFTNGPNIQVTTDANGNENIACPNCAVQVPLAISLGIDWPPSITNAMNDEFITAFNVPSNIWTVVNQNSNTIVDGNSLLNVTCAASATNNFVGIYQANPSTPYAVASKIALTGISGDLGYAGLAFRDSGTGKVVSFKLDTSGVLKVDHWASPTGSPTNVFALTPNLAPHYFEVEDNGTNFLFFISSDGVNYIQVYSEGDTAYLASPGQVGYIVGSDSASAGVALGSDWFRRVL